MKLAKSKIKFVYFEAFDLPWKTKAPVEPHWGFFRSDRTPKLIALELMPNSVAPISSNPVQAFYIFRDSDYYGNHFKPTGFIGDIGDIEVDETYPKNPHSGKTSLKFTYLAKGNGPHECGYMPPCKWAGVYWLEPPNNWGKDAFWRDAGFDLSKYRYVRFFARSEHPISVEFKVGGILEEYGDSLQYPRGIVADLTNQWKEFQIDLKGADLTHIIGGFVWVLDLESISPSLPSNMKVTFYLDDIRFEN